jgi:hypothetical protein
MIAWIKKTNKDEHAARLILMAFVNYIQSWASLVEKLTF